VNASPLIFLTWIGLLKVLDELGVSVVVSDVVVAVLSRISADRPLFEHQVRRTPRAFDSEVSS
jgi:hypothetical protein